MKNLRICKEEGFDIPPNFSDIFFIFDAMKLHAALFALLLLLPVQKIVIKTLFSLQG